MSFGRNSLVYLTSELRDDQCIIQYFYPKTLKQKDRKAFQHNRIRKPLFMYFMKDHLNL